MSGIAGACASFADLFRSANGRSMNETEREELAAMAQADRNEWVRRQAAKAQGHLWLEDRLGTDGIVYTAFGWYPQEQDGLASDTTKSSSSSDRTGGPEIPTGRSNRA